MIKFFHTYKRSVVTIFVALLACFVMTTFGVDFGNKSSSEYALKIDETEISHQEFYREKRNVESNYRRMLGDMYDKYEKTLLAKLNEQLVDRMIADTLIQRFATSQELFAGHQEVQAMIAGQVFGGQFDPGAYRALLAEMGLSAREFENRVAGDVLKNQFTGLISDTSSASQREVRALFEEEETKYDLQYVELKPTDFSSQVRDPGDVELQKVYESRQDAFELPASVLYEYAVLRPERFSEMVEVSPEDIEAYYHENKNQFALPEELHLRHIQINYPKETDDTRKAELKEKALRLQQQAVAGDAFPKLAQDNSEDAGTSATGGDLGWIRKGILPKEVESAAFKLLDGEVSDVIDDGASFRIFKLDERKPEMFKPLDEVRSDIISAIRRREAPSYMAAKAWDLFDEWSKSNVSLSEFAAQNKLSTQSAATPLSREADPSPELKGLTAKVLDFPQDKRQLVELTDVFALVNVTRYEEAHTPSLAEARVRVFERYKTDEAKKLASQAANVLLQSMQGGSFTDLKPAAEAAKLSVKEQKDIKRGSAQSGLLASDEIRSALFGTSSAMGIPSRVFESEGKFYVFQVQSVKKPDMQKLEERREQLKEQATRLLAQNTVESLVNSLKAKAQIDVDQSILVER